MKKAVLLYPAYNGRPVEGSFVEDLVKIFGEDMYIVPLFNGNNVPEESYRKAETIGMEPILVGTGNRGLAGALLVGYQEILSKYPNLPIVRTDADSEHSLRHIQRMWTAIQELDREGMVVGNLVFNTQMLPDTFDWSVHNEAFPRMYEAVSGGTLNLSCAHGLQAFSAGALNVEILDVILAIIEQAETTMGPIRWGVDGLMAIVMGWHGQEVAIEHLRADIPRENRGTAKVLQQAANHAALLRQAYLYGQEHFPKNK